jgi:putative autoinducer-2 (AI-2) aldolase
MTDNDERKEKMDWGMKNRINRIFQPKDGRAVMLAVDHGYFLGPISKLEEPKKTIEPLLPYADSLMLTRGVLRNCIDPKFNTPIILRASGGNSIAAGELSDEDITCSMEDALRLNVSAVALSIYVGTEHQRQTIVNLSRLVDEGTIYGIPVLAVTAVGKELEKRDAKYLALSCRIAAEMGSQMVKTYYCDDFFKIIKSCPVPVVIAGGPKLDTELDVLNLTYNAIREGAVGVDMGRNIFQSSNPVGMIKAVAAIVHEGASVKKAQEMLK